MRCLLVELSIVAEIAVLEERLAVVRGHDDDRRGVELSQDSSRQGVGVGEVPEVETSDPREDFLARGLPGRGLAVEVVDDGGVIDAAGKGESGPNRVS
jgi:hypothetical protein